MEIEWFRRDEQAVLDQLRRGARPLMAASMASGPLDGVVAPRVELGAFEALKSRAVGRIRSGIDDTLLFFRTQAVLPFLPEPVLDPAARARSACRATCSAWDGRPPGSIPATTTAIAIATAGRSGRYPAIPTPPRCLRPGRAQGPGGRHRLAISAAEATRLACLAAATWSFDSASDRLDEIAGVRVDDETIGRHCRKTAAAGGDVELLTDGVFDPTRDGWVELKLAQVHAAPPPSIVTATAGSNPGSRAIPTR